jgi:hypothetical protein
MGQNWDASTPFINCLRLQPEVKAFKKLSASAELLPVIFLIALAQIVLKQNG